MGFNQSLKGYSRIWRKRFRAILFENETAQRDGAFREAFEMAPKFELKIAFHVNVQLNHLMF